LIEERHLQLPQGLVYARKWTPESVESSTPIVLIHDSLGCVGSWRGFPLLLAESLSRCVIAYDRLGFGRSDARIGVPSIKFLEEEATSCFPLVKTDLGLEKYVLLGHSVGGGMAINIAAGDSDCVAVVTMAAQAFIEERTIKGLEYARRLFRQPEMLVKLSKWHGDKAEWVLSAWLDRWLSADFADWSLRNCIGSVNCPVLAIHGENDEYGSRAFPEFISGQTGGYGKSLILEDCGHMPHKEKPDEVIVAIKAFLFDGSASGS
jgi:pimeloyl-ACP methyl ester carboxylesterase